MIARLISLHQAFQLAAYHPFHIRHENRVRGGPLDEKGNTARSLAPKTRNLCETSDGSAAEIGGHVEIEGAAGTNRARACHCS